MHGKVNLVLDCKVMDVVDENFSDSNDLMLIFEVSDELWEE